MAVYCVLCICRVVVSVLLLIYVLPTVSYCRCKHTCTYTHPQVKTQLLHRKLLNEGFGLHVTTAIVAGFVSALASSPFDVVKSRVMNQPFAADGSGTL